MSYTLYGSFWHSECPRDMALGNGEEGLNKFHQPAYRVSHPPMFCTSCFHTADYSFFKPAPLVLVPLT